MKKLINLLLILVSFVSATGILFLLDKLKNFLVENLTYEIIKSAFWFGIVLTIICFLTIEIYRFLKNFISN
jgi:hypothetical protein